MNLEEVLTRAPEWRDRTGRTAIPMRRWGLDHWSLLLYVETRVTDCRGQLDWNHLTLSRRNWPMLHAARNPWESDSSEDAADAYGLRLRPLRHPGIFETMKGHCEADALMDLVEAGLVTIQMPPVSSTGNSYLRPDGHALDEPSPKGLITGHTEWLLMPWARFRLTEYGWTVAEKLRRFKADGGLVALFTAPQEEM